MYGPEVEKCMPRWKQDGFLRYMTGRGVDIGWRGDRPDAEPVPNAEGVDLETPGYDGIHLPYEDESLDFVFSSHMLEHVSLADRGATITDWFRTLKIGGFIICIVPRKKYPKFKKMIWGIDLDKDLVLMKLTKADFGGSGERSGVTFVDKMWVLTP